jgi:hypothetical protein
MYSMQLKLEPRFAHFRVTGENTPATVRAYLRELFTTCAQQGLRRVLIEESLDGPRLYSGDVASIAGGVNPRTARLFDQIAYVDVNATDPALSMEFAGAIAADHGLNIRVFSDLEAARAWLGADGLP